MDRLPQRGVSHEARQLAERLRELGVERSPLHLEKLLAAARMALHAVGAQDISIEIDGAWGLDVVAVDGGDTLTVDAFLLEADTPEDEEPFL